MFSSRYTSSETRLGPKDEGGGGSAAVTLRGTTPGTNKPTNSPGPRSDTGESWYIVVVEHVLCPSSAVCRFYFSIRSTRNSYTTPCCRSS